MSTSRRDFVKGTLAAGFSTATGAGAELENNAVVNHATMQSKVSAGEEFTRGVGVYPGAHDENFSPTLVPAGQAYRNLALLRPAYHSSSYDYNLTAQLVTDGITHQRLPKWVSVSVDGRVLTKPDREIVLDHFQSSLLEITGAHPVIEFHLAGGEAAPSIDRLSLFVAVPVSTDLGILRFRAFSSMDGRSWTVLGETGAPKPTPGEDYPPDLARANVLLAPAFTFSQPQQARFYRVRMELPGDSPEFFNAHWGLGEVEFYNGNKRVQVGGPYAFTSAWKSAGLSEEWVYVDLGDACTIDRVILHWIAPAAEGSIQVSNDAEHWRDVAAIQGGAKEEIAISPAARARFIRALMRRPASGDGYILSEFEVFGRGGLRAKPKDLAQPKFPDQLHLAGGNWRVQRADQVGGAGTQISSPGYQTDSWIVATVPGSVLTSYLNAGAIPDPNFGENQLYISDSYFYSDFWYRTEFIPSTPASGTLQWLEFDGINWKANVYLNGEQLGRIEGAFQRARYNVTGKLRAGQPNALAVLVEKNATPGSAKQKTFELPGRNGGALGADNPTFHSSVGWDWISTIRGRNTGIWNSVRLTTSTTVTVSEPAVTSVLPAANTARANVTVAATVINHNNEPAAGVLRCKFGEGIVIEQRVSLAGGEHKAVVFSPETHPPLAIQSPRLWWPVGYGEPNLHDVDIQFKSDAGEESRALAFKAGIRQITASEEGGALRLWVNGRRIVAKGGNWGFSESMLRYRAREYDAAVRYHREMNFNMIRNWVGQIGEDAFYEACDRHGVLVWQDFWLANPWDGPIPNDNAMFLRNARDLLLRIRMHASVAIYCGRNEWFPPKPLDDGLRALLKELHPDLHYIGSSADGPVSGHGPYQALPPETYFRHADSKLHSEIGSPNIPSDESLQLMMPKASQWPQGLDWGLHDFCLKGAQGGESFRSIIDDGYGGAANAKEWVTLAQFVNYDTYRAMFEAQGKDRMGVLLWMSHPCWPSFVWQTYDYFLEPTAAYFACKNACEPIHIQRNPLTEKVEVVNCSAGNLAGLTAKYEVLDAKGVVVAKQTASISSHEDSLVEALTLSYPNGLQALHFVRLSLWQETRLLSKNLYLRGYDLGDYREIRAFAQARVNAVTTIVRDGQAWTLTTKLKNTSPVPALMVRAKVVRSQTGDRVLPAIFSDNYVTLMPGEEEEIRAEVLHTDTRGEKPRVVIDGFNVA